MKLRLSRFLAAALLASLATAHAGDPITFGADLGDVMYVGDSITHGVNAASWRWSMHKIFVDNGISYDENGFKSGNSSGGVGLDATYGGRAFENVHSAEASGDAFEIIGRAKRGSGHYGNSNIYNWLGVDKELTVRGSSTGSYTGTVTDHVDTFLMLIGTNDLLSAHTNDATAIAGNASDDLVKDISDIYGVMQQADPGSKLVLLSIPCWTDHANNTSDAVHQAVVTANNKIQTWADSQTGVTYVDVNTGLIDVSSSKPFWGPRAFFNNPTSDGLHPNAQGEIIIAGNVARAMGYAGRTVGLDRADATTAKTDWGGIEAPLTVTSTALTVEGATFDITDGCTVDFNAAYGNGGTGGWDTANAFTITVGDGAHTGTLSLTEAYVKWGDTLLYCRDNSVVSADNLRIAYVNPSVTASDNVSAGYYVWLGDQLIGEALTATTGDFNGIRLQSTGVNTTVSSLTWSDTAYAPTTTAYWNEAGAFKLVQSNPMPSHDNTPIPSGVDYSHATPLSGQTAITSQNAGQFSGTAVIELTRNGGWFAVCNATTTLDIKAEFNGRTSVNNLFAVQGGTTTGNILVDVKNATLNSGTYSGVTAALAGSFGGANVTGCFSAYIENSTLNGDMVGGAINGSGKIGSVNFIVNSGTVNGSIYGGSKTSGTVGNVAITINGGTVTGSVNGGGTGGTVTGNADIRIRGGIIKGSVNGGTVGGTSTVTVEGNLASIGGNISADKVVLKDVSATPYPDGFDKYAGTVTASDTVTLDNYRVENAPVNVVAKNLALVNGSKASLNSATLTGNGSINLTAGTELSAKSITCSGATRLTGAGTLAVTGVPANLTLDSAWSGTVRVSDANVQNLEFDKLAQGDSILELNGFSGWSKNWNGSNTQNIRLTDSGSNVAWENGAYSQNAYEGKYSGNWSGEGTLVMYANNSGTRHTSATFTGDISEWSGKLLFRTNNATSDLALKFGGKVDEVNAEIGFFGTGGIINMTVESDVTFTKDVNVTSLTVAQGKTATFQAGFTSEDEFKLNPTSSIVQPGVTTQEVAFSADDGGVKVTNTGVQAAAYSTGNAYMLVHADTLSKKGTGDVTVNNQLEILNVVNTTGGKLTLSADEVLELHDMTLTGQNAAVEVLDREKVGQEAKVSIGGTLTAGGATLLANLELQDGATLDVDGKTMTLGSQLTLGNNLYLDAATMQAMDALEVGQTHYIIRNYQGTNISYTENYDGTWYGSLFNRVSDETDNAYRLTGDYTIVATPNEVGFYKVSMTPEPTTGTLSVLALAALAARRRKRN